MITKALKAVWNWKNEKLRDIYPHARWYQVWFWKMRVWTSYTFRAVTWTGLTGGICYSIFLAGAYFGNSATVYKASAQSVPSTDTLAEKVDQMKNQMIDQIASLENETNIPIVIDDNKAGTLPRKDKVSIGCMQFKISTVETYEKSLYKKTLSDNDAILLALDCTNAKALAKDIVFNTTGGLWNWSVATKDMGTKVEIIKTLTN